MRCIQQDAYRALWDQVHDAAVNRDPYKTDAAHLRDLKKTTDARFKNIAGTTDSVTRDIKLRKAELDQEIKKRIGIPDVETARASEIRTIIRGMSAEARGKLIKDAIDRRDGEILAATMTAPSILTGIPDKTLAGYYDHAIKTHAPELKELQLALDDANRLLNEAFLVTDQMVEQIEDSRVDQRKTAEQAAKAQKALESLSS